MKVPTGPKGAGKRSCANALSFATNNTNMLLKSPRSKAASTIVCKRAAVHQYDILRISYAVNIKFLKFLSGKTNTMVWMIHTSYEYEKGEAEFLHQSSLYQQ